MPDSPAATHPPASAARSGVSRAQFLQIFFAVALPMFMSAADQTLLATATPSIAAELGGLRDTSWIAVGYLLASAVIVPVYGRLGDARGHDRMLLGALVVFSLGAIGCGTAQSLPQLLVGRVVEGLGGGGLMTLSQSLIGQLVAPRERIRYQAYFAAIFTTASVGGPIVGGIVVSYFSWRWLFFAYLPLAAYSMWRLARLHAMEKHVPPAQPTDAAGIGLFSIGMLSLLYWLTSVGHHFRWDSAESAILVALSAAGLGALLRRERRHPSPFIPIDLFRNKAIALSVVTTAFFGASMFAMVFFLPIYLQLGHRVSASHSGLLLLPLTGGTVCGSAFTGRFAARTGEPKIVQVLGLCIASCALFVLGLVPSNTALIATLGFLAGTGFGTVMPVTQVVTQTVAGRERLGAATSMVSLFRSVGAAAGTAVFGALVYALLPDVELRTLVHEANEAQIESIMRAFHAAFLMSGALAAIAAFTASRVPKVRL